MSMSLARTTKALHEQLGRWKADGLTTSLVPTMGALHQGHLRLVEKGLEVADKVLVSIFINPKQFAAHEDLKFYPRDEATDLKKLAEAGADLVFLPTPEIMYPQGFASTVHIEGPAKAGLEDKFRPHFFDGVATVVAKLFIASGADYAMFGEKDYQQLKVVTRMAADLDINTKVIGVATEREESGLAMSSRNLYLSRAERHQATAIYKNLSQAAEKIRQGVKPQNATRAASRSLTTLGFRVDYLTARNAESLAVPQNSDEPLRLIAAAWLGKTRLIDNIAV